MQEHIKRLAVEAGFDADNGEITAPYTTINGDPMDITEQVTKLVLAVARECAQIASQTTEYGALDEHGETKAYATEAAIRARFGLEG